MTFGEYRPVCKRRWEQTRTSQGADSDVAGARFECRSSQMRVWLVLDALTGIGNETAARVPQFSAYALRRVCQNSLILKNHKALTFTSQGFAMSKSCCTFRQKIFNYGKVTLSFL